MRWAARNPFRATALATLTALVLLAALAAAAARAVPPASARVAEPTAPGNRTNGRIFGYAPGSGQYSCSGTSLDTPSGSIVLTAGHCIYEDGVWGRNLVFVPAYDHGRRPFGTFVAVAAYAMPRWLATENSDYDVGALRVRPNRTGTLRRTVGARRWTSGRSRYAPVTVFGYPAGALAGEEMRACGTRGLGVDPHATAPGTPTFSVRCQMGGGSSGGAWLLDGMIDGVTSYGYRVQPNRLYSPYFGPAVAHFLSSLP